jgi:hypothetical protein
MYWCGRIGAITYARRSFVMPEVPGRVAVPVFQGKVALVNRERSRSGLSFQYPADFDFSSNTTLLYTYLPVFGYCPTQES